MSEFLDILLRAALVIGAIVLFSRLHGLRSFSKMSGFDFAITVSIGSVLAGAVTTLGTDLWIFIAALACLFGVQIAVSLLRIRSQSAQAAMDNTPILVMRDGKMLHDNMRKSGMTVSDLRAKLREANAYDMRSIRAVVMEATGDVSVLHGPEDGPAVSDEVLEGVRGTD